MSRRLRWAVGPAALALAAVFAPALASSAAAATGSVTDGNARFTVESPTLIRVEYAGDGGFEDRPTFNAINRSMPTPPYTTSVANGYRIIQTASVTLRYLENSGPFGPGNLSVDLTAGSQAVTAHPSFPGTCAVGAGCEAEGLALSGSAAIASDHGGYTGSGFVAGFAAAGAKIGWQESGVPAAGQYAVQLRYANATGGDNKNETRTVTVTTGDSTQQVSLPVTANWDTWSVASATVTLPAGGAPMSISCGSNDSCNVNVDSVAVTPVGAAYPTPVSTPDNNLGGYRRGLDGQGGPAAMADGVLSRDGWYLMDDTQSAILDTDGTVTPRPSHSGQPYQDGYFFGYGHNYKQGLKDLHDLTGPSPLLPREAFGVWYSRYYPYSASDYQNTLIPAFRANRTPIDTLVADTDWKAPNAWDGWEFNSSLVPDPKAFFSWAASQDLQTSLNIHPSIAPGDPQYAATVATAGTLADSSCYSIGDCKIFNFLDPAQLKAYFNLHSSLEQNGQPVWWLDQSNGEGGTPVNAGVTPDSWINAQYKAHADAMGGRGYVLGRIGGNGNDYSVFTPPSTGAWADHRSAVHFTGDTSPTWAMLAFEAQFTAREGSGIGEPYVSHDIGGFYQNSANASNGHDNEDLYARWVQLGTFQPILRLHSDHGDRLPWNYSAATAAATEKFLRLRESLVPYTYTLARQAVDTGLPIVRGLYLNYPEYNEAYSYAGEYTYGDDVLVAPVSTPGTGSVSSTVWFPPGSWTDYFTGRTYTGPGTAQVTTTLDTMPVFLRSGGIMTTRSDYVDSANQSPMNQVSVDVAAGGDGSFSLYEDSGQGNGYQSGQSATTPIGYSDGSHTLTIGARQGTYPGAVANRTWTVKIHNLYAAPSKVTVNGSTVSASYDAGSRTATVQTGSLPTSAPVTVTYALGTPTGPITSALAGKCIDVNNAGTANGTAVQLWDCNGTSAQQWTVTTNGALQALGKCMDVSGGATANGTLVQLWDCNGTTAQQWQQGANHALVNPQSGRCLDDPDAVSTNGTQLQIYDCNATNAQQWTVP
ncbi:TIM-barrel domain-containing protein [Kutzneria sp. CA-103260]|uniref:TIM-barrel domain-containing protein n=1 Tax=Kutzneria sp. CA-103260 TaxID=2802641 RepID=UPI001BEF0D82|nr:TIM-barrel domain-containing protein [Kutzneria sp. CA-103260]QUQ65373.1 Glycosyl hydrolases family 31 [Kutzneria sp. CA-103260]